VKHIYSRSDEAEGVKREVRSAMPSRLTARAAVSSVGSAVMAALYNTVPTLRNVAYYCRWQSTRRNYSGTSTICGHWDIRQINSSAQSHYNRSRLRR